MVPMYFVSRPRSTETEARKDWIEMDMYHEEHHHAMQEMEDLTLTAVMLIAVVLSNFTILTDKNVY